jgi:hypothetical protein
MLLAALIAAGVFSAMPAKAEGTTNACLAADQHPIDSAANPDIRIAVFTRELNEFQAPTPAMSCYLYFVTQGGQTGSSVPRRGLST